MHGPAPSLALSPTPFNEINLVYRSSEPAKDHVPEAINATDGPVWAMTDLAIGAALGMAPVALQSGGDFVAPTAASMTARSRR